MELDKEDNTNYGGRTRTNQRHQNERQGIQLRDQA
jgi:hypothetical protein